MTINFFTNGTDAEAPEVNANFSKALTETARNTINYNRIESVSGTSVDFDEDDNTYYIKYDAAGDLTGTFNTLGSALSSAGAPFYSAGLDCIYLGDNYDTYSDASFDTNLFTSTQTAGGGSVTDSELANTYIQTTVVEPPGNLDLSLEADGDTTTANLNPTGTTAEALFQVHGSMSNTIGNENFAIYLTDGSTRVTLYSAGGASGVSSTIQMRILVESTTAYVWHNGQNLNIMDTHDLASLAGGSDWYIEIRVWATNTGGTGILRFYHINIVDQTTVSTDTIVTAAKTITSTDVGFLYDDSENIDTKEVSLNGGSNYTTLTLNGEIFSATAGTSAQVRYTLGGSTLEKLSLVRDTIIYTG